MFKKIVSVLIVALMLFVCAACDSEEAVTALELYNKAIEKHGALTHYDVKLEMNMKMSASGMNMDVPIAMTMKLIHEGDNIEFASKADMTLMGVQTVANTYYKNGVLYTDAAGAKFKMTVGFEEAVEEAVDVENAIVDLPEEILKDVELAEKDGGKEFTVTFDGEKIKDEMNSVLSGMDELLTSGNTGADISDITLTVKFNKDGYITYYSMVFDMKVSVDILGTKTEYSYACDIKYTFNNIGEKFEINYPDFSNFTEMPDNQIY